MAYDTLGAIFFRDKQYAEALKNYLKAEGLAPQDHSVLSDLGDCYQMLGDKKKVVECYTKAASILSSILGVNPTDGSSWMTLALYYAKLGMTQAADENLTEARRRGAISLDDRFLKARVYALLGKIDEAKILVLECLDEGLAIADVEIAIELAPVRASKEYRSKLDSEGTTAQRASN